MASYEYFCDQCKASMIENRSISDPEPTHVCKECDNEMKRIYSMAAPVFKGSGFYRTDR